MERCDISVLNVDDEGPGNTIRSILTSPMRFLSRHIVESVRRMKALQVEKILNKIAKPQEAEIEVDHRIRYVLARICKMYGSHDTAGLQRVDKSFSHAS